MPASDIVDVGLATFSDYAYRTALVLYLVAMVVHLGEYARARVAAVPIAVGAPAAPAGSEDAPGVGQDPVGGRSRAERFGRTAVALTILGAVMHAASLVLRGAAAYRIPWGNMYEFMSAICLVAVVGWLLVLRRSARAAEPGPGLRRIGAFVLLPVVVLMFLAGTVLYADAAPVMPALRSYWLAVHVTTASLASGLLLISGVASVLFLVRRRTGPDATGVIAMLPARDTLDRVAYRTTVIAFPIWTFAVITGAIWAEAAWGRYWGWDPKETVAFVAWVVYAGYLHARATAGWRDGPAAWVNVFGFAVMLFNLFFVNLVTAGLHSYAGVG